MPRAPRLTHAYIDLAVPPSSMARDPTEWIDVWQLRDRTRLTVRPVLPQDAPLLAEMVRRLLPDTRNQRFHGGLGQLPDEDSHASCMQPGGSRTIEPGIRRRDGYFFFFCFFCFFRDPSSKAPMNLSSL